MKTRPWANMTPKRTYHNAQKMRTLFKKRLRLIQHCEFFFFFKFWLFKAQQRSRVAHTANCMKSMFSQRHGLKWIKKLLGFFSISDRPTLQLERFRQLVQKVDQGFILSRDSRSVYLTALVAFLGISICRRLCDDSVMLRWRVSIPLLTNKQKQNPHYILCILLGTLKILDYDSSPVKWKQNISLKCHFLL